MFNIKESKVRVDNMDFDYISFGKGKKNLVIIQGLNTNGIKGSSLMLSLMYRKFTKDYKVYLFERRMNIDSNITVKDFADDYALIMKELGIENANIFGVSQGGMIAEYLAIYHSELVNKLVLAVTLSKNNKMVEEVINRWINLTKEDNYKELVKDMLYKMYSPSYIKKYKLFLPLLTILQKPKDKDKFINLCKSCLTCNAYNDLDKIKCKTLVIGGALDYIVGKDAMVEIKDKLNCDFYIYEELGHALYEEAKDFNDKVYSFLKNRH